MSWTNTSAYTSSDTMAHTKPDAISDALPDKDSDTIPHPHANAFADAAANATIWHNVTDFYTDGRADPRPGSLPNVSMDHAALR